MNNQFENFNNSSNSQNALDKLSEFDNYRKPSDDIGIRPIFADLSKGRPTVVVKKKKDGKVIIFTQAEILKMQIEKNFKVSMKNISKEEHKANKKISKHLNEIVKNINGAVLLTSKNITQNIENKVLAAGKLISNKIKEIVSNLTSKEKKNIKKLSKKLKLLTPKTKAVTKKIVNAIKKEALKSKIVDHAKKINKVTGENVKVIASNLKTKIKKIKSNIKKASPNQQKVISNSLNKIENKVTSPSNIIDKSAIKIIKNPELSSKDIANGVNKLPTDAKIILKNIVQKVANVNPNIQSSKDLKLTPNTKEAVKNIVSNINNSKLINSQSSSVKTVEHYALLSELYGSESVSSNIESMLPYVKP